MATLDRSKPFAQIVNDEEGRAFEQNGKYFTASGDAWAPADAPAPAPAPATGKKKAAAASTEDTPPEAP
jgi:hypothetical protein